MASTGAVVLEPASPERCRRPNFVDPRYPISIAQSPYLDKRGLARRMPVMDALRMWLYEPDENPKKKHHWKEDRAGFEIVGHVFIGKCPRTMSIELAETLLNSGIAWSPRGWRDDYPQRIYSVWEGVLYRATPTNPGRSYHGFPEHYSRFPPGSRELRSQIINLARERNCEHELREWMRW